MALCTLKRSCLRAGSQSTHWSNSRTHWRERLIKMVVYVAYCEEMASL